MTPEEREAPADREPKGVHTAAFLEKVPERIVINAELRFGKEARVG